MTCSRHRAIATVALLTLPALFSACRSPQPAEPVDAHGSDAAASPSHTTAAPGTARGPVQGRAITAAPGPLLPSGVAAPTTCATVERFLRPLSAIPLRPDRR